MRTTLWRRELVARKSVCWKPLSWSRDGVCSVDLGGVRFLSSDPLPTLNYLLVTLLMQAAFSEEGLC
jgi:hypothetical protein